MRKSKLKTVNVPGTGFGQSNTNPVVLTIAPGIPMRLLVRNVGGATVFLTNQNSGVQGLIASRLADFFVLPAGMSEVFVLAPGEGMYAIADGVPVGTVSCAASEAVPAERLES